MLKNIILWVVIAVVLMSVFNNFGSRKSVDSTMSYSQFIAAVNEGQVKQVNIDGQMIRGMLGTGEKFTTYSPGDDHLVDDLLKNHVEIKAQPPESQSL
ncbi:ATP-dependent metallopeptidase FtsH/Yme1/Tma family protein, partial [Methylocaldum sp.]|uniref:ATP-dependent metallopeptidase FtsH/Yme1/Tma family protein n=1 Tax=Methylocaldum sp. TaxID=1969727 RepID=UPI002D5A3C98